MIEQKEKGELFRDYPTCGCTVTKRREITVGVNWIAIHSCERCHSAPVYLSKKAIEIFMENMANQIDTPPQA